MPEPELESSTSTPSLGVAICVLDEERELPRLLARLARGEREDRADEVAVADGGSRDRSAAIALDHGARLVRAPRGRGSQLAAAARALASDVLVFLHADCVPAPGALALLRRAFARGELAACGLHQRIDARGLFYRCVERAADLRVHWLGLVYGDSGLCVRRSVYERCGGFRSLPLFEDVDLSRRLRGADRARLLASAELAVSPRRWQREGALRATLRNWMLTSAYFAGANPAALARWYRPHSEPST